VQIGVSICKKIKNCKEKASYLVNGVAEEVYLTVLIPSTQNFICRVLVDAMKY